MIDRTEFARRLCEAAHPFVPPPRPCGQHLHQAEYLLVLTTEPGTRALEIIRDVRAENGLGTPGRVTFDRAPDREARRLPDGTLEATDGKGPLIMHNNEILRITETITDG